MAPRVDVGVAVLVSAKFGQIEERGAKPGLNKRNFQHPLIQTNSQFSACAVEHGVSAPRGTARGRQTAGHNMHCWPALPAEAIFSLVHA